MSLDFYLNLGSAGINGLGKVSFLASTSDYLLLTNLMLSVELSPTSSTVARQTHDLILLMHVAYQWQLHHTTVRRPRRYISNTVLGEMNRSKVDYLLHWIGLFNPLQWLIYALEAKLKLDFVEHCTNVEIAVVLQDFTGFYICMHFRWHF